MQQPDLSRVIATLAAYRFSLNDEKMTQAEIAAAFGEAGVSFAREYRLDETSTIDFLVGGSIGVEVKIKGGKMDIYRQIERYAKFDLIGALILATNVPTGFPPAVEGKPVYIVNLARAWL